MFSKLMIIGEMDNEAEFLAIMDGLAKKTLYNLNRVLSNTFASIAAEIQGVQIQKLLNFTCLFEKKKADVSQERMKPIGFSQYQSKDFFFSNHGLRGQTLKGLQQQLSTQEYKGLFIDGWLFSTDKSANKVQSILESSPKMTSLYMRITTTLKEI